MRELLQRIRMLVGVAALTMVPALAVDAQDVRRPKKLIATGWDKADTQRLRQNLEQMERRPFDGVIFEIIGRDELGRPIPLRSGFQNAAWKEEWFQSVIDELVACRFRRFTDNFVQFGANPGDVDWFDDGGWQAIVDHWRIAAWAAKQSGCKGILFDPEPYVKPHAQFRYDAQPEHGQHSFEEYYAKARERGRGVMEAVMAEYPDITLFCYFMNSVTASATGRPDPRRALAASGYGLYPAMIDGWLDAAPPSVSFVDGCESAYRYNSGQEYLEAAVRIKGACQELVSGQDFLRRDVRRSRGECFGGVETPEGASRLVILRGVSGQNAKDEVIWCDDVALYRQP